MDLALKQSITSGGRYEERERLWRISRYSNDQAHAAYGFEFMTKFEDHPDSLIDLDLLSAEVFGRRYPVLYNGSNDYSTLSKKLLRLSRSVDEGIDVDLMMVIPEAIRLLQRGSSRNGLTSALRNKPPLTSPSIVDAESIVPDRIDRSDLVRAYDSHPSTGTYFLCMDYILKIIGCGNLSYCIPFNNGLYKCDLAERFSSKETKCVFANWQHHIKDLSVSNARNTGLHQIFRNENAPVRASILLIGDSHSYSALAPMLSNAIENVRFIWASRRDNYQPFSRAIENYAREADFIVEEISERFFLKNFCEETFDNMDTEHLLPSGSIIGEATAAHDTAARQSPSRLVRIDRQQSEDYINAGHEIDRAYSDFQKSVDVRPVYALELSEASFRAQAIQTVLQAVLSSLKWRGLDRRKFRRLIKETSRLVPNSGPAAIQHDVLLAEARKVLGLTN